MVVMVSAAILFCRHVGLRAPKYHVFYLYQHEPRAISTSKVLGYILKVVHMLNFNGRLIALNSD